jgi:hypothetical protein
MDYHLKGTIIHPARYLPLTPRLAVWTNVELDNLPKMDPGVLPARASHRRQATAKFVRDMNITIIQSAEISSCPRSQALHPRLGGQVQRLARPANRSYEAPAADGHYQVIQTRACPSSSATAAC